jgi:septal ring factor EnvC (AmiA/AmiB activator)
MMSLAVVGAGIVGAAAVQAEQGIVLDIALARAMDEVDGTQAQIAGLKADARSFDSKVAQSQTRLAAYARGLYRLSRPGVAPIAGGYPAMMRHVARIKRLRGLVRGELAQLATLRHDEAQLRERQSELEASLSSARERLDALQHERKQLDAMAVSASAAPPHQGGAQPYGLRVIDGPSGPDFTSQRGRLASPVTGDVRVTDSRRTGEPALMMQAPTGTPVRAAAAGRVAFSDRQGTYGRMVIVDHGNGYTTLYGGLGAVQVQVGDTLSQGARLGAIGNDFSPPALLFEVRRGSRSLPPRAWLGY